MSNSISALSTSRLAHTSSTPFRLIRPGAPTDSTIASTGSPVRQPSTTVTLSQDGLASAKLASEGITVIQISGASLGQLVETGQTPLVNSPGMSGGDVSRPNFEHIVVQANGTKEQADQLFSTFDGNDDGVVSPNEILSGLSKVGDKSPFARTLLSVMDKNGDSDGTVSSTEFVRFETELVSAENPSNSSAA
jgi:hypothetical protein